MQPIPFQSSIAHDPLALLLMTVNSCYSCLVALSTVRGVPSKILQELEITRVSPSKSVNPVGYFLGGMGQIKV